MQIFFLLVVVIIVSLGIFVFFPRNYGGHPGARQFVHKVDGSATTRLHRPYPFMAVSINTRAGACQAAKALESKRFLLASCPALPLNGCDASRCNCGYTRYPDRRAPAQERRHSHVEEDGTYYRNGYPERRTTLGRRESDWVAA